MNWGQKIIIVYIVFIAGMILLAFKCAQQKDDLVTADYYDKELVYQTRIDEMKRTALLTSNPIIKIENKSISIRFPKDFLEKKITGMVQFYCPSNPDNDLQQPFSTTENLFQMSPKKLYPGLQYIQLHFTVDGVSYYYEQKYP